MSPDLAEQMQSVTRVPASVIALRPLPMRLLKSKILQGCNVHHGSTVIRQDVDLGGLAGLRSGIAGPEFAELLLDRFFDMRNRVPGCGMAGGFIERLRCPAGVPFEEVLFESILAVETAMAFVMHDFAPIGFTRIVFAPHGRVQLIWECHAPAISRAAARVGLVGCVDLLPVELHPRTHSPAQDFRTAYAALEARARRKERSTTTAVLARAAKERGLPCEGLGGPHLRLGHGATQRHLYASATDRTSLAASQLARSKYWTTRRLAELQLPTAKQLRAATVEDAMAAAAILGYPLVIKPLKEKQAAGVTVGISKPDAIPAAFERARRTGRRVILESFVPGRVHRLLVVGGRFVAALQTVPPTITGDGVRTIAELIEELNRDPLRDCVRLFPVEVDDELARDLSLAGYRLSDVLEKKRTIALRPAANVATGGLHGDVTDRVHPDNQEMAVRAAAGIGLDVAGVDFVTEDISRSYKEAGGSIIEVNARPGLCMHTLPRYGQPRPVAHAVLDLLFPAGATGRIPVAIVAADRGGARVARNLDAILRASGLSAGLVTRKRSFVNGRAAEIPKARQRQVMSALFRDPRLQALIGCISLYGTVERGLGIESCDVAAILRRRAAGEADPSYQEGVKVVASATHGMLVVSAGNAPALEALSALEPKRLVLVTSQPSDPLVERHVAAGGACVTCTRRRGRNWIVLSRDGQAVATMPLGSRRGKRTRARRTESAMFAVALAFGLGLIGMDIRTAAHPSKEPGHRVTRVRPRKLARKLATKPATKPAKRRKPGLPPMERSWLERPTFARAGEWGLNLEALGVPAFGLSLLTLAQDFAYGATEDVERDCILIRRDNKVKVLPMVSDWKEYDGILRRLAAALPAGSLLGYVPDRRSDGSPNGFELVECHREFVFHRETVAGLAGASLATQRRQVRQLLKAGARVEPIGPTNLDRVRACNDRWYAGKRARGRKTYYRGRTLWTFENLALLESLGVRHLALVLGDEVIGYAVSSHIGASWAVYTFHRGDREPWGVAPYLLSELGKLHPDRQWINDGPAVHKPGLAWFKERFTSNAADEQVTVGWIKV